jgi:hypothetical protein
LPGTTTPAYYEQIKDLNFFMKLGREKVNSFTAQARVISFLKNFSASLKGVIGENREY